MLFSGGMTLTSMMRIAREGSLATVLAVALIAVPSLAFAGPTPTTAGTPHTGSHTPLPAVHGVDPGNHGTHVGTPSVPGSTTGTTTPTDPNATTANAGSSIGMEVTGGVLIGLGILMLLLKGNSKAQTVLQSILQAVGMGSVLNGSMANGGIINMLGSLLTALNGGTNPLAGAASTIGTIASTIGGAGTVGAASALDNSNVGLNAERVSLTSGAITAQAIRDVTQIGFGRKGSGNR